MHPVSQTYLSPTPEQIQTIRDMPLEGPVIMLNLLRFKPDGGAEEYARYGEKAAPFLEKAGASIRYLGRSVATVIGGEEWDEVILVEYPSKQAFLEMTGNPDYPGDVRSGALLDSRLYCTQSGR
jgi:uncharacterized protein (DUF1330 family)